MKITLIPDDEYSRTTHIDTDEKVEITDAINLEIRDKKFNVIVISQTSEGFEITYKKQRTNPRSEDQVFEFRNGEVIRAIRV